jgi:purine-cytosine permease-like protein
MPAVEAFGVEPIPPELRDVGWLDFLRMVFAMHFNPLQYVLGSLAVVAGGLPLWWAATAIAVGNGLAFALLAIVGQTGVDYGLSGQVAMRATFGEWGARALTSPYRIVAATYLFAAQALAGGLGIQAITTDLMGNEPALVPIAVALATAEVLVAIVGFRAFQRFARLVVPLMFAFAAAVIALYLTTGDPSYSPSRVFASPQQSFTWTGFASFVTVMGSGALSNVTNVADFCRYGRSRRDLRIGLIVGAVLGAFITAWVGAYAAVATGSMNPFVAISDLTSSAVVLVLFLIAIIAQTASVSILNVYSVGLSLTNVVPRLGRPQATVLAGVVVVAAAAFPDFIT